MGTFMSKHCSGINYGSPAQKKSCANYGTPLNQEKKEHVPAEFKDENFMKRLESLNPQTKKNIMDRIRKRDSMAIAKYGSIEAMKKMQVEAEKAMTPEQRKRDDY